MSSSGWNPTSMPQREAQLSFVRPDYGKHGSNGQHGNGNGSAPQAEEDSEALQAAGRPAARGE